MHSLGSRAPRKPRNASGTSLDQLLQMRRCAWSVLFNADISPESWRCPPRSVDQVGPAGSPNRRPHPIQISDLKMCLPWTIIKSFRTSVKWLGLAYWMFVVFATRLAMCVTQWTQKNWTYFSHRNNAKLRGSWRENQRCWLFSCPKGKDRNNHGGVIYIYKTVMFDRVFELHRPSAYPDAVLPASK